MSPAACERCSDWVRSAFLERELLFTGIGGQGVQLAAQVLARAAMAEGREVQLFGSYGGMMRGGNTDATVVVADDTIESPPTVTNAWSAIIMHHEYAADPRPRKCADALVLINSTVVTDPPPIDGMVLLVPATDLAAKAGNIIGASLVMLGAYVAITGVVGSRHRHRRGGRGAPVVPVPAHRIRPAVHPRRLRRRTVDVGPRLDRGGHHPMSTTR